MRSLFHRLATPQDLEQIDNLLKDFRLLRSDLPESEACKIKFNNRSCGVSEAKQKEIDGLVFKINSSYFIHEPEDTQLKLMDLLTLYANHLDQQTSDKENPKLPPAVKDAKALSWLEAAYLIGKKLIPNLDESITAEKKEKLLAYKPDILSSLSLMLYYFGRLKRYNKIPASECLPLLASALAIANHLESAHDIHYYSSRVATFEMPVILCLRNLKRFSEAEQIITRQLQKSYETQNLFHMIQGHAQISEVLREQFEAGEGLIDKAIEHAEAALKLVQTPSKEDFRNHCIDFNAKVAAIRAYHCAGNEKQAKTMAEQLCTEYEKNPNCGAKPWHIEAAQKILTPSVALTF
jgi:hypothetical protein